MGVNVRAFAGAGIEITVASRRGQRALGALLVLAAVGLAVPSQAQGTFGYRKSITINGGAGGITGGPHLNFPVLVSLPNDASLLARVASGGRDIVFRGEDITTCAGLATCMLSHEIERYDGATGTLVAWVKVPSVTVGTVIYMYYGNAQITGATETPAGVFDAGYVGVWHLGQTGSGAIGEYRDSSAFANHGRGGKGVAAAVPARVAGEIGYAQNFSNGDGTYNFVDVGNDGSLNISGPAMTMQAWVRHNIVVDAAHGTPPATSTPYGILAHKGWDTGYSLWLQGEDGQCPGSAANPCVVSNMPGRSGLGLSTNMAVGPAPGAWHHVATTYNGATQSIYVDGVLQASQAKTGNVPPSAAEPNVYIGQGDLPENVAWSGQFEGDIDEVRISNVTRSANWLLSEYRNQSAPGGFYAVGGETPAGAGLASYTVNLRSIGTALDYVTGTVNATLGSVIVDGVGTLWSTNNRGRGDRITINAVDYTILAVDSETRLRLTSPFQSATSSYTYTIARKFGTPQAWENCISGGGCPGAPSTSLVDDNRSEIGIYYYDGSNPVGSPVITFDGSITDAAHTITLTVDPGNRHPGRGSAAPTWAAFADNGANALVQIYDDYVTVEWLELRHTGGASTSAHSVEINNVATGNHSVIRYNVIHGTGSGIQILDADTVADVYDNVIYATNYGIRLPGTDLNPTARLNIFNNTIYGNTGGTGPSGIKATVRQTTQRIDLRNNIVHSNNTGDIGIAPPFDRAWFFNSVVYTDITAQVADSTANFTLNFTNVPNDCLYVGSQNPFRGLAVNVATGSSGGSDLQWSYWNGAWANLETSAFSDGTFNLQYDGYVYWSDDPAGWVANTVNGSGPYFYVRACLASGPPATKPIEAQIGRADLSIASTANLTGDMTGLISSPRGGFLAGQNGVPLANVAFVNTGVGTENLHLQTSSVAINAATTLDQYFVDDIDATMRFAPWDVGADEAQASLRYRSVGTNAADMNVGPVRTVGIAGTTATFSAAMPNNVGVGDVLKYGGNLAFIHGRTSSTTFTVASASGGTPVSTGAGTAVNVYRAYTSLFNWEAQTENPSVGVNFDTSTDLVAAHAIMLVACYADGADTTQVNIDGWITGADTYIHIFTPTPSSQVGVTQRHSGVWDTSKYRLSAPATPSYHAVLTINDEYVRVTGLQIENTAADKGVNQACGIGIGHANPASEVRLSNNLLWASGAGTADWQAAAILASDGVLKVSNNILYKWGVGFMFGYTASAQVYFYNNTIVYDSTGWAGLWYNFNNAGVYFALANNIVQGTGTQSGGQDGFNYMAGGGNEIPDYAVTNLSSDATSPNAALQNKTVTFVGAPNYHLGPADTNAKDQGTNLSADPVLAIVDDIDGQARQAPWDIGADDANGTTAVKLMSFAAVSGDGSVVLEWRTASELDNLGFYLFRGLSEGGPWTRLNASLIAGLGSSATGQAYSYRDAGLVNGVPYFYRLEDVDASSKTTSHGPVSAVPLAGAAGGAPGSEPEASSGRKRATSSPSCPDWVVSAYASVSGASTATAALSCTRHGDPDAVSFAVVSRDSRQAVVELRTGGFYALREASGHVRVFVRGFDFPQEAEASALPVRRALVDAVVGRRVQLGGVRALEQASFPGLVPSALGKAEMEVSRDGTVRAGRRVPRALTPELSTDLARLLPSVFQGEAKSAVVLISPLRFDARRRQLLLAKRVRVRLLFTGRETAESGRGSVGRRGSGDTPASGELLARLYTTSRGLYAVSFDQLFPRQRGGLLASELRLERQGEAQAFHLEPASGSFGPGGVLYFHADTDAVSTDFSSETAFELVASRAGVLMPLVSATPAGGAVASASVGFARFETNRFYQPGLLDAADPWLWENLASGTTRTQSFSLTGVSAAAPQAAELEVFLQGASESGAAVDHHVSVSLNGTLAGEARFAGKQPYRMTLAVPASLLREGANELQLTNVADTGATSYVFLDRFTLSYPQASSLAGGRFEGTWSDAGTVTLAGVAGQAALLDVTTSGGARWLRGYEASGGALRFRVEAAHRYLVVAPQGLLTPRVAAPAASSLRATTSQADYLLIAPRAFLAAAEPLLERRRDQGLTARGVAFEEIADAFGHGQPSAEAIHSFLAFAFQSWARPSPRYVLLLGDSNYDPRNFTGTAAPSPLPALWTKTSYLWTASDPLLAAVNGEDALPDLAIGRLPAATVEEAQRLDCEAAGLGGLRPGPLGSGGARGRQPRPRRRLRGGRARHRAELPRRQGIRSCCC